MHFCAFAARLWQNIFLQRIAIQGVWYEVELASCPAALHRCIRDVLLNGKLAGGSPSRVDAGRFYGRYVYAKTKR